jgi:hypothetical protein
MMHGMRVIAKWSAFALIVAGLGVAVLGMDRFESPLGRVGQGFVVGGVILYFAYGRTAGPKARPPVRPDRP